ncbi:nucleoside diphosphate kinase 7-like [Sceloporus undulatus]|uniref:nucleoside diphosphate kinase 7-like n=1 Tax=Sceloporus undulatus TaxID=8520 RepID=UPI001C4C8BB4|nr:nucleoside diphosphate kinase 7-like [Sceloporus undulatus]
MPFFQYTDMDSDSETESVDMLGTATDPEEEEIQSHTSQRQIRYDMKNRCRFLNRTKYEDLHFKDLFVGNKITIYSRHLNLVDYGDQYTARMLGSSKERTLALLKPDTALKLGEVIDIMINSGFTITKAKMMQLTRAEAIDFHADHQAKPYYKQPALDIENHRINLCLSSEKNWVAGEFYMDRANSEEFYAIYKGVVAEYPEMVVELCSGPCIALEIRQVDPEKSFRNFCGPSDPEIARYLRPGTLRAIYGKNKIQNAVHCTDLPEDGLLEVQYFFNILDK